MVIKVGRLDAVSTMLGSIRQMVIDRTGHRDTMHPWETRWYVSKPSKLALSVDIVGRGCSRAQWGFI